MGIPRLTQDVSPFIESAILGKAPGITDTMQITRVVVDGPSLIYHVCNKILLFHGSVSNKAPPTYTQINMWLMQFLKDVESCGVEITRIFFDGALPVSKRDVREERLEKTRQQLENARRFLLNPPVRKSSQDGDFTAIHVWSTYPSHARSPLPHPPFMVASAIEFLNSTCWKNSVSIVPGEADPFCASYAATIGAAVLSNDSDILLFDLKRGSVMPLHDLQLEQPADASPYIKAQCFRPRYIAKRLGVQTMLEYGYHRYTDASATCAVIAERTRTCEEKTKRSEPWRQFCNEYQNIPTESTDILLHDMDPRVAELIFSCEANEELQFYPPILIEDHDRDSSWSYGLQIRRLAYSVLCQFRRPRRGRTSTDSVRECARKGARITSTQVNCLSELLTTEEVNQFISLQSFYNNNDKRSNKSSETVLSYYLLAIQIVIKKRISDGKDYTVALWRLFENTPSKHVALDWSDMHLLANIQAVLYSIRILHQITIYVLRTQQIETASSLNSILHILSEALESIPSIQALFLNHQELYSQLNQIPPQKIKTKINEMLSNITSQDPAPPTSSKGRSLPKSPSGESSLAQSWIPVTTSTITNKRRKKTKKRDSSTILPHHSQTTKSIELTNVPKDSANSFSLLRID